MQEALKGQKVENNRAAAIRNGPLVNGETPAETRDKNLQLSVSIKMSTVASATRSSACCGSRGLGRAFAQALVAAGARVAITARGASELHEIAAQLSSAADQVIAIPADVVDPEAAPRVVAETEQRLGPITLLINNAGQFRAFGRIGDMDPLE